MKLECARLSGFGAGGIRNTKRRAPRPSMVVFLTTFDCMVDDGLILDLSAPSMLSSAVDQIAHGLIGKFRPVQVSHVEVVQYRSCCRILER